MSLLTVFVNGLIFVFTICLLAGGLVYIIWRCIFQCKGYEMKNVIYKNSNLIIQRLNKGKEKNL